MKDEGYRKKNLGKWNALNDPLNKLNEGNSLNKVKEGGCTKQIKVSGIPFKNKWKNIIINEI